MLSTFPLTTFTINENMLDQKLIDSLKSTENFPHLSRFTIELHKEYRNLSFESDFDLQLDPPPEILPHMQPEIVQLLEQRHAAHQNYVLQLQELRQIQARVVQRLRVTPTAQ